MHYITPGPLVDVEVASDPKYAYMTLPELRKQIRDHRLKACPKLKDMKRPALTLVLAKLEAEILAQAAVPSASMQDKKETKAAVRAGKIAASKAESMAMAAAKKAEAAAPKLAAAALKVKAEKVPKAAALKAEKVAGTAKAKAKKAAGETIQLVDDAFAGPPVKARKLTAAERKARVERNKAAVANVGKTFEVGGMKISAQVPHGVAVKRYMDAHPGVKLGEASKVVAAERRASDSFA